VLGLVPALLRAPAGLAPELVLLGPREAVRQPRLGRPRVVGDGADDDVVLLVVGDGGLVDLLDHLDDLLERRPLVGLAPERGEGVVEVEVEVGRLVGAEDAYPVIGRAAGRGARVVLLEEVEWIRVVLFEFLELVVEIRHAIPSGQGTQARPFCRELGTTPAPTPMLTSTFVDRAGGD
jgi:hypothetical protein